MRRSVLLVMLDVMVLSVLSMSAGSNSSSRLPVPLYRWSALVEEGIKREKEYADLISELRQQAELAAARELEAKIATRVEEEKRGMVNDEIQRVRDLKQAAEEQARAAERVAHAAETKAKLAVERQRQAQEKAENAEVRAAEAARRALQAEELVRESELATAKLEGRSDKFDETVIAAQAREEAALKKLALALEGQAEAKGRAKAAEEARQEAIKSANNSQEYIVYLRDVLTDTKLKQKVAELELKDVAEEKEEVQATLNDILTEKQQSVWIRRDKAMRRLSIRLGEHYAKRDQTLFVPVLQIGKKKYIVEEFKSLEFDWREIQYAGKLDRLELALGEIEPEAGKLIKLKQALLVPSSEPRICYLPLPGKLDMPAMTPIGMQVIKEDRIQRALLFKKEYPNLRLKAEITPDISGNHLTVKVGEMTSIFRTSKKKIEPGDYLLTENGRFIGVMVSKTKCYVVPEMPLGKEVVKLPLTKSSKDKNYKKFVAAAKEVSQMIRDLPSE